MFLTDLDEYNSLYVEGAREITLNKFGCTVKNGHLIRKPLVDGDKFFFNEKSILTQSIHNERDIKYKVIYLYKNKRIKNIMKISFKKVELSLFTEFTYDKKGRIKKENCTHSLYHKYEYIEKRIHDYQKGLETIHYNSTSGIEDSYTIFKYFDDKSKEIEEKAIRNNDELVYWIRNIFNDEGDIEKVIELDEKGELETQSKSDDPKIKWRTILEYDKKGNWNRELIYRNDILLRINERFIKYYE